jgi:hypothetical protein
MVVRARVFGVAAAAEVEMLRLGSFGRSAMTTWFSTLSLTMSSS